MATASKTRETEFTTPSDRELVATRVFDAPRDLVWDAFTKPEHIQKWLLGPEGWTMPVCEIDLRPGGSWHFVWRRSDGKEPEFGMTGVYREVKRPERLVHTENWGGDWAEALDTYVFTEEGGKTKVVCTVQYPSKEARDRAIGTGMKEGWAVSYDRLDDILPRIAKS
jgi:uncharacterized protein YndB with AHSA1/START domain